MKSKHKPPSVAVAILAAVGLMAAAGLAGIFIAEWTGIGESPFASIRAAEQQAEYPLDSRAFAWPITPGTIVFYCAANGCSLACAHTLGIPTHLATSCPMNFFGQLPEPTRHLAVRSKAGAYTCDDKNDVLMHDQHTPPHYWCEEGLVGAIVEWGNQ